MRLWILRAEKLWLAAVSPVQHTRTDAGFKPLPLPRLLLIGDDFSGDNVLEFGGRPPRRFWRFKSEGHEMTVVAMVPVRLQSTRLPEKAIADIAGLPMFVHTCKRVALASSIDQVYLATDDESLMGIAASHDIAAIMTATHHTNSSERAAEACQQIDADIVVNVQGDEPLVYPRHIDQVVGSMLDDASRQVAVGITRFNRRNSPGDLKGVMDKSGRLLYASRNDIPCFYRKDDGPMWKLSFIVPFRKLVLLKYLEWKPTALELAEDNHFQRLPDNGIDIHTVEIEGAQVSVDTADDLEEVRRLMEADELKDSYM